MIQVRRAKKQDIPAIMELLKQVNMVHHIGRPDLFRVGTKYTAEELGALLEDEKRPVFVATDSSPGGAERVLAHGFCIVKQEIGSQLLTDVKTLYIDDICVDEAARGSHVGRTLYEAIRRFAAENDFYNITLNVWTCNEPAMRFYESLGMRQQKIGMEMILKEKEA
jgi:ribosomal protein S18 acetylase RimI-like enzyme